MLPSEFKKLRTDLEITQRNLARALGTTPQTVSNWEGGRTHPRGVAQMIILQLMVMATHRVTRKKAREAIMEVQHLPPAPGPDYEWGTLDNYGIARLCRRIFRHVV
jgi:transcriptional regulator with XRE-family HTH domain